MLSCLRKIASRAFQTEQSCSNYCSLKCVIVYLDGYTHIRIMCTWQRFGFPPETKYYFIHNRTYALGIIVFEPRNVINTQSGLKCTN